MSQQVKPESTQVWFFNDNDELYFYTPLYLSIGIG